MFCAKKGEIESHQLPPCRDCLERHAERANYQAAVWKRCLEANPHIPTLVGRRWVLKQENETEQLAVHWMEGKPAPEAVLDLLACNCKRKCERPSCICLENGLKCTDMCRLQDCENQDSVIDMDYSDTGEDIEDDIEDDDDY